MKNRENPTKKTYLFTLLSVALLASCASGQDGSGAELTYSQVPEEILDYDYSLTPDPEKGEAIYPDVAYRKLKEIEAHNRENGVPFFESGYRARSIRMKTDGEYMGDYLMLDESYIPGTYYYYEENSYFLMQKAEGYFSAEEEFFHGFYDNDPEGETYYTPSSVAEMEAAKKSFRVGMIYADFLKLSEEIAKTELLHPNDPTQWRCYTSGEGDLYLNLYRTISDFDQEQRFIFRIVYEDYLPKFAIAQRIEGILGNEDYKSEGHSCEFSYSGIEMESGLITRFSPRRDQDEKE